MLQSRTYTRCPLYTGLARSLSTNIQDLKEDKKEEEGKSKLQVEGEKKKPGGDAIDKRVYPIVAQSLLTGTAIGIILPVMPIFAIQLGLSASQYGIVMSMMGVSRLVSNIPAAWAAEKYGRRPVLLGGNILTALGLALTGMSSTVVQLVSARFFTGSGSGFSMTASGLYLTDISTVKNRARTIAPGAAAFVAGMGIGPGIG